MEIVKNLLDKGTSVDLTNVDISAPVHVSALHGNLEATKTFVKTSSLLDKVKKMVSHHCCHLHSLAN